MMAELFRTRSATRRRRSSGNGLCGVLAASVLALPVLPASAQHDPSDPLHAEHMQAMSLVDTADATHTAVADGDWHDPATWENGILPGEGARVWIPSGLAVRVDGVVDTRLMNIRVDGTLRFRDDVDTQLRVDTLVTAPDSLFEMGTPLRPIQDGVRARIIIDDYNGGFEQSDTNSPDYDISKLGQGIIAHGAVRIHGKPVTGSASCNGAVSGADRIMLDSLPSNWSVGDSIVIAGTTKDAEGDEVRTIAGLLPGTGELLLDNPLVKDHVTPSHHKAGLVLKVHVINTTRNAVIETESTKRELSNFSNSLGRDFYGRGHVMFMHTNDVEVRYAGLYELGRTDKKSDMQVPSATEVAHNPIARYSLHFHRAGTATQLAQVQGCAVVGSPGWGYVNHSSAVDLIGNVAYDVDGGAFIAEAGNEIGSFVDNVAIRMHGGGDRLSNDAFLLFGSQGDGFWLESYNLIVTGNVASGFAGSGFVYSPQHIDLATPEDPIPAAYHYDPEITTDEFVTSKNRVKLFRDNLAYASESAAIRLFFTKDGALGVSDGQTSLYEKFTAYNVGLGVQTHYYHGYDFTDMVLINDDFKGRGVYHGHLGSTRFINNHIEGFAQGYLHNEQPRPQSMIGGYYNNRDNIVVNLNASTTNIKKQAALISGDFEFGPDTVRKFVGYSSSNMDEVTPPLYEAGGNVIHVDNPSLYPDGPYKLWLPGNLDKPAGTVTHPDFDGLELEPIDVADLLESVSRGPAIPNLRLDAGAASVNIDLNEHFEISAPVVYEVENNSDPSVAGLSLSGNVLTVAPGAAGESFITMNVVGAKLGVANAFQVTVGPEPNTAPVAVVGPDQELPDSDSLPGESVTLDGTGSSDSDGSIASHVWTENGSQIATGDNPTLTLADGIHTLTLTVTDDDGATDVAVTMVRIGELAPMATNTTASTPLDTAVDVSLPATDGNGDSLTYHIVTQPLHGTASVTGGVATYTPDPGHFGPDRFTFKANDGTADSNISLVEIEVEPPAPAALTTPVPTDGSTVLPNQKLAWAADSYASEYNIHLGTSPTPGLAGKSYGASTFDPGFLQPGTTYYWFIEAVNGAGTSTSPVWSFTTVGNGEDTALSIYAADASGATNGHPAEAATDDDFNTHWFKRGDAWIWFDLGSVFDLEEIRIAFLRGDQRNYYFDLAVSDDALSWTTVATGLESSGTIGSPQFEAFSLAGHSGRYVRYFGHGNSENNNDALVEVEISGSMQAPVAYDGTATVDANDSVQITLSATDANGDTLSYSVVDIPTDGTLNLSGNLATYTPQPGFSGSDSFTFKANDGVVDSNIATIDVTVLSIYQIWQNQHYSPAEIASGLADRGLDSNGDGNTNEFAFYFGLNPRTGSNPPAVQASLTDVDQFPAITYTRRNDPGIDYSVHASTDLKIWSDVTSSMLTDGTPIDHGDGTETIKQSYPVEPQPGLFLRVGVSEP